jgi:type IV secretion system protein VirB1
MLPDPSVMALAQECAPMIAPHTLAALVRTESGGNPYAIGVVGLQLAVQPQTKEEAISTATALLKGGRNISVGLGQVNHKNFENQGLTLDTAFDTCSNLRASGSILQSCYERASAKFGEGQEALKAAFSCYYSNNFTRGFQSEGTKKGSYVQRVAINSEAVVKVPEINFKPDEVAPKENTSSEAKSDSPKPVAIEDVKVAEKKESTSWDVFGDFTEQ